MSKKKRSFSQEFKLQVVKEADAGVPIVELTRRYEITGSLVYKWRRSFKNIPDNPFPGQGSKNTEKAKIAQLERIIGRQAIEIEFLKNLNARLKGVER